MTKPNRDQVESAVTSAQAQLLEQLASTLASQSALNDSMRMRLAQGPDGLFNVTELRIMFRTTDLGQQVGKDVGGREGGVHF